MGMGGVCGTCCGWCGGIGISDGRGITLSVTEIPKKDKSVSRVYRDGGRAVFALSDPFFSIDGVRLVFDYCLCTNFNNLDFRFV